MTIYNWTKTTPMRVALVCFALVALASRTAAIAKPFPGAPLEPSNQTTAHYFQAYYARAYALRTLNHTATTLPLGSQVDKDLLTLSFDWSKTDRLLSGAFERYQKLVDEGEMARIAINGTTQEAIDFAADQVASP